MEEEYTNLTTVADEPMEYSGNRQFIDPGAYPEDPVIDADDYLIPLETRNGRAVADATIKMEKEKHFRLLTDEENTIEYKGKKLYRIQCIKKFRNGRDGGTIYKDEKGGFIEKETNLCGNAWVNQNAKVLDDAVIYDNALVSGDAVISGNALVYGNAIVSGTAAIWGHASVNGHAEVMGNADISGNAVISNYAFVGGNVAITDHVHVFANAALSGLGDLKIYGDAKFGINACIKEPQDFIVFSHVGSRLDTLTVYKTERGGVRIMVGCFLGSIDEFKYQVLKTHENNPQVKNEYLLIIDIIKNRFNISI